MFRASSLPGKPGRFRASNYLCSSEHTCIGCIAQIPRFRALPSFLVDCSEHCFYAMLGTLLLCRLICSEQGFFVCFYAPNTASMLGTLFSCLIPLLYACFYALLGTLLLCRFQASDYPLFGTHIYWLHTPNPHLSRNQACSELMIISNVEKKNITFQSRKCTIIKKVQWRHQCNISFLEFLQLNEYETAQDFFSIMP